MNITILWWYWFAFGMLLMMVEIFVPSFTIFWFGLAALVVALLVGIAPDVALSWQLTCWAFASILFTLLWFRYFKPLMLDRTKAGISLEAVLGQTGQVVRLPREGGRGLVRFVMPLLGAEEWEFLCGDDLAIGDRVMVVDVSGNTLVVTKKGS
ncbi:NfeD family protein [Geopsychrobacter electrodiphilus]|uniref:NfeD family protein n=1 Tax=Geopsychrobacter electrodiphilus TaxID=225196 RepID=UPI00036B1844|nr:NfeD family protein [Geopsychrobacter electrodiphilus]